MLHETISDGMQQVHAHLDGGEMHTDIVDCNSMLEIE